MTPVAVAEAKSRFSDLLRRAEHRGERIVVHRHGKPVAAIVSTADLEQLEALEDAQDRADATMALKEAAQKGTVALEDVLRKHGLEYLLVPTKPARAPVKPSTKRRPARRKR